jgi:hypothetical protein
MITTAELHRCATRDGLRFDQAEKDYVILLLLSALSARAEAGQQWFFNGGWNRKAWTTQLSSVLRTLPEYDRVWAEWVTRCKELL